MLHADLPVEIDGPSSAVVRLCSPQFHDNCARIIPNLVSIPSCSTHSRLPVHFFATSLDSKPQPKDRQFFTQVLARNVLSRARPAKSDILSDLD
jgi:hypothetical protein